MTNAAAAAIVALAVTLCAAAADAQLSPGPLHERHEALKGLRHCLDCHELGKRVAPEKCLACHAILKERIESGRGLHATEERRRCEKCHSDHQGSDYAMIAWEGGREAFDHSLTGTRLGGAHAALRCDDCHAARFIADRAGLAAAGKDLDRTHLGLSPACGSCHPDPHEPTLGPDCRSCHGESAWRPTEKFEHAGTRYPLTGRHGQVACGKCHPESGVAAEGIARRVVFRGATWDRCDGCHADPHAGGFRQRCDECHDTGGWRNTRLSKFDHDATRYPLRGRHAALACEKCHVPGAPHKPLAHTRCLDCHADHHAGQFANSPGGAECSSCHAVAGFRPADYPLVRHQAARYPLVGSHLAVACAACHGGDGAPSGGRYRFESTLCVNCHADPHALRADSSPAGPSCESCHALSGWRQVAYDHSATRFALRDAHARTACGLCHRRESGSAAIRFGGLETRCAACHADPHLAQFMRANEEPVACERCHDSQDWLAVGFDHERDASFSLRGAHEAVRCEACHPPLSGAGAASLLFRPLAGDCRACHAGQAAAREGGVG